MTGKSEECNRNFKAKLDLMVSIDEFETTCLSACRLRATVECVSSNIGTLELTADKLCKGKKIHVNNLVNIQRYTLITVYQTTPFQTRKI